MIDQWDPWKPACMEYFSNFKQGRFDEGGQHWFIFKEVSVDRDLSRGDLVIGSAGCDGISFCFRKGMDGVWAYYPIEEQHLLVASNLHELEVGWLDGTITV